MIACWSSDPQERAKFASLTQQLSNLLEQEAGYLDLQRSLSWRTHRKPQKKASRAKPPVLQSTDESVTEKEEERVEMAEVEIKDARKMKLREEAHTNEKDCAV